MKIFDHDAKYTDEEWIQFSKEAYVMDDETKKRLMKFFYGGMGDIDPEKKQRILNGTEPVITTKHSGTERATEVPLIHDLMSMEAKAKVDLMTGPIALDPKLVEQSTPYIFNLLHMTKDDHLIISRRAVTCSVARPFTKDLGNGYCEQIWLGDITKWPMYVEYDEEFK